MLDRDGTIIVNRHHQKDPGLTELLPRAAEGLGLLRSSGLGLVMVSNQSGVGRGLMSAADVEAVNRSVSRLIDGGDDYFDGVYYCPHLESDLCGCRKPRPGLALRAARELGFLPGDAFVVGDREIDVELGRAVGAAGSILVRTGYGAEVEAAGVCRPDFVADDLLAAARRILAWPEADA